MTKYGYKYYVLTVLMLASAFSNVDRLALGLVLQDIKEELLLSDSQLGLLTGMAFAFFYALMGIPIARWADRGNRVIIISIAISLWSVAVTLCGLAGSFLQLLMVRIGVAVGEAGCNPPAHSLIADYFSRPERPRAVAIYMLGGPLSCFIGYFLAGWLNERYGWRATFMLLGVPGLVMGLWVWFTLREPRNQERGLVDSLSEGTSVIQMQPSVREVFVSLWANKSFLHLLSGFSVLYFFGCGIQNWQPAFFVRSYGLQTRELGVWLTLLYGFGGLLGTYLGGELASRYARGNERLQIRAVAMVYAVFGIVSAGAYLAPTAYLALVLLGLASVAVNTINGPLFATIQTLAPPRMRAMAIALLYLSANLVGMGLGPLAAGALSDALRPLVKEESLRYSLVLLCPGYFWATWHFWRASRTVTCDLRNTLIHQSDAGGGYPFAVKLSPEPLRAES